MLRLLFGLNATSLHARELERRAGVRIGAVRQEAARLVRLGLLSVRKDGNRTYYEANRQHPLFEDIHRMVLKTVGLVDVLKAALNEDGIRCAFVFGSMAQGTAKAESDIDLMVVGNVGLRQVTALLSGIANRLGRDINPHVMTADEFGQRVRRKEHFVDSVMASAKWFVVGSEDDLGAMGR
jgi:predicted nucleotidyltransferase